MIKNDTEIMYLAHSCYMLPLLMMNGLEVLFYSIKAEQGQISLALSAAKEAAV